MLTLLTRGWVVGLLTGLVLLGGASPAPAHAELESSDPKDGATLSSAPSEITFVFGEEIISEGIAVTLTDVEADTRLEVGPVEVDGDTVSVTWPQASPAGNFRAAYRVVSEDGHPIDGTITFTVKEAVGIAAASPSAVSATPAAVSDTQPAVSATASASPQVISASPSAVAASPATTEGDSDTTLLAWVLGIGCAVLIGAVAGTWYRRRTR